MLTLWKPNRDLWNWTRELDDFFGSVARDGESATFSPAVDVEEKEDAFVLRADVPGIAEKDIEVSVQEGTLVLSGKRDEEREEKSKGAFIRERRWGSFRRSFRLNPNIDAERINAAYKNGVLTVTLPKKPEVKAKQIPVKGN